MVMTKTLPLFKLGQVCATPDALALAERHSINLIRLIERHHCGDCGDMCAEDIAINNYAIETGDGRIFSSYKVKGGKVWIITEHDRSSTCIMLPENY